MQQDTKNKLLATVIIGTGVAGALLLTSMQESFERITKCQESAECQLDPRVVEAASRQLAPSQP